MTPLVFVLTCDMYYIVTRHTQNKYLQFECKLACYFFIDTSIDNRIHTSTHTHFYIHIILIKEVCVHFGNGFLVWWDFGTLFFLFKRMTIFLRFQNTFMLMVKIHDSRRYKITYPLLTHYCVVKDLTLLQTALW